MFFSHAAGELGARSSHFLLLPRYGLACVFHPASLQGYIKMCVVLLLGSVAWEETKIIVVCPSTKKYNNEG